MMYRVHFTWKNKEVTLSAYALDMSHPYFVSIKDIVLPPASRLIIDPTREEFEKHFGKANHLMIPFQSVSLIEELEERDAQGKSFSIVDMKSGSKGKN